MSNVTLQELEAFRVSLEAMFEQHHAAAENVGSAPTVEIEMGKKYARIVQVYCGRSAYAFVGLEDGAIYMAASYKAPAKHARGNIRDANPLSCCGPYGVAYLR